MNFVSSKLHTYYSAVHVPIMQEIFGIPGADIVNLSSIYGSMDDQNPTPSVVIYR